MSLSKTQSPETIVIQPSHGWVALRLRDVWIYRELLYFLTLRHVKVRYKQTILGAAWAIIQPLFAMIVFTLFFGRLAAVPSDGFPYPIFVYTALVPWTFFAQTLTQSTESLVSNANLITKIYFPRLIIPLSIVGANLIDFALAFSVLVVMAVLYGIVPTLNLLFLPLFLLLNIVTALGIGLWLTALNVQFRDVRHIVPFLAQLWLFATPVIYPSSGIGEPWRTLYGINPMVGVIEGFRWSILGTGSPPGATIIVSAVISLLLLVSGAFYFRRMEKRFADIV
ncbi:MAG: ABC transporter permease [Anaerolineae bacterium]